MEAFSILMVTDQFLCRPIFFTPFTGVKDGKMGSFHLPILLFTNLKSFILFGYILFKAPWLCLCWGYYVRISLEGKGLGLLPCTALWLLFGKTCMINTCFNWIEFVIESN